MNRLLIRDLDSYTNSPMTYIIDTRVSKEGDTAKPMLASNNPVGHRVNRQSVGPGFDELAREYTRKPYIMK